MANRPLSAFSLTYAARTDTGRVRARNEDAVLIDPDWGVLVVADGVGGAHAGDVASNLATQTIAERMRVQALPRHDAEQTRLVIEDTIEEANITIWQQSKESESKSGMGTTVVVGAIGWEWLVVAHVGDSRIYRLRNGQLEQLSRDHSFIQEVIDQGFFATREDAKRYGIGENILTRALGSSAAVKIASAVVECVAGDVFLFCTDGLTGMVPDDWMRQILTSVEVNSLDAAADALLRIANERGGNDNITLALLQIGERNQA
ncbi:serine/threonine protein phosphatase [Chromatium okenii]|uniref:PP2C family protein-serine/threonine phosphatase n=1 Tax=Chromatium okenii TaxID=61644 RepID=UPI00190625B3|nr:protein phosphatase 2C domain-containing protein [Chromatium okenii]MBK1642212.1 serine/threonine protein phosphatase [Chromatium okenii]